MRKVLYSLLCAIFFIVASCTGEANTASDSGEVDTTANGRDTTSQLDNQIVALNDTCMALRDSIMSLNARMQDRVDNLEKAKADTSYVYLLFACFGVVAIIVLVSLWHGMGRKVKYVMRDVERLRTQSGRKESQRQSQRVSGLSMNDVDRAVSEKIAVLQRQINDLTFRQDTYEKRVEIQEPKAAPPPVARSVVGYWGLNSKADVINVYSYLSDECVFKVEYVSDSHARFEPISMNKLFAEDIKYAVEMTGCLLENAHGMEVQSQGEASRKHSPDGRHYWHIDKLAKVKLIK